MGKRELIALLNLSSWCLVMVERLFLAMPRGCLQFVNVVFPDHTHLLFFLYTCECDDERACYLVIKKHVYSKTKYVNIPSFHSSHHFNSPLKLKFRQSTFVI